MNGKMKDILKGFRYEMKGLKQNPSALFFLKNNSFQFRLKG